MNVVVPDGQEHVLVATTGDGRKAAGDIGMTDFLCGNNFHVDVVVFVFGKRHVGVSVVRVGGNSRWWWKCCGGDGWLCCLQVPPGTIETALSSGQLIWWVGGNHIRCDARECGEPTTACGVEQG